MIYIELKGGLGNQLFQLSNGYCLAKKLDQPLALFFNDKNKFTNRKYSLDFIATKLDYRVGLEKLIVELLSRTKVYKLNWVSCQLLTEGSHDQMTMDNLKNYRNIFVRGYWADLKYFTVPHEEIVDVIKFKDLSMSELVIQNDIKQKSSSVGIHIRRGDYLNVNYQSGYSALDISYYLRAISFIKSKIDEPFFYLFSDDITWVKSHFLKYLNGNFRIVEDSNAAWKDMCLMSNCKHLIAANSTFSWWASFLNKNEKCIKIAPRSWKNGKPFNELMDNTWVQL